MRVVICSGRWRSWSRPLLAWGVWADSVRKLAEQRTGVSAADGFAVLDDPEYARAPEELPGLIADLQEEHVNPRLVPGTVLVSAVSLLGGASLGPEKALSHIGGEASGRLSRRRGLGEDDTKLNTLSGFAGAFGVLFSSTVIVVMLILEIARPGGQRLVKALLGTIVASSVSFGIYFAIVGSVFRDAYQVPKYKFEDWQLLAGIPLGLFAAVLVTVLVVFFKLAAVLFGQAETPGRRETSAGRRGIRAGRASLVLLEQVRLPLPPLHRLQPVALQEHDRVAAGLGGVAEQEAAHVHPVDHPGHRAPPLPLRAAAW